MASSCKPLGLYKKPTQHSHSTHAASTWAHEERKAARAESGGGGVGLGGDQKSSSAKAFPLSCAKPTLMSPASLTRVGKISCA